jgi:sec-independent protein translocase protein TatC
MTTTYTEPEQEEATDESSMSFLEHLDELRSRLIRCAIFIGVAFLACWAFSDRIYQFLEIPVKAAMIEAQRELATKVPPADMTDLAALPDGTDVTFCFPTEVRIGAAFVPAHTCGVFKVQRGQDGVPDLVTSVPWVINNLTVIKPGFVVPRDLHSPEAALLDPDTRLVVPTVQGAFNLYIKVAFYGAIFFAVPFLLVQAWGFVSPGLYPHEKKYAGPFIIMSSVCFIAGCAFAYYIAFPRAANFLLGVAAGGNLRPWVAADAYFDLILTIMLGLGLVFEMPAITFFLARLGLVTPHMLIRFWRMSVILIMIAAALLSPTTDVPNLLVFAAPMLILYFVSVGIAWVFYRKRRKKEQESS